MGPWLADTIRQCDGLVDMMSYWTFSDVFEEQGVVKTAFLRRLWTDCGRRHSQTFVPAHSSFCTNSGTSALLSLPMLRY